MFIRPVHNYSITCNIAWVILLILSTLGGCAAAALQVDSALQKVEDGDDILQIETLNSGLQEPWGMDFLPDGRLLVTEKVGRLRLFDADFTESIQIGGVPEVADTGQGGLMDVLLAPDFDDTGWVYLSYTTSVPGGTTTRVSRARLRGDQLVDRQDIFTAQPAFKERRHYGSRLHLDGAGFLFLSVGDRGNRERAQQLDSHNGKIIRLQDDGAVPMDNPFVAVAGALPEIWSYGHRNPQGMAAHPVSGELWISEHGPQGGDEINRVIPGKNYGWPVITYGEEYGGGAIGDGTSREGMEQPLVYWVPSIGTGGIAFYDGSRFDGWQPSLLVAGLRGTQISRLVLSEEGVAGKTPMLEGLGMRIRDLQIGPDGVLYALAAGDRLLRISPGG